MQNSQQNQYHQDFKHQAYDIIHLQGGKGAQKPLKAVEQIIHKTVQLGIEGAVDTIRIDFIGIQNIIHQFIDISKILNRLFLRFPLFHFHFNMRAVLINDITSFPFIDHIQLAIQQSQKFIFRHRFHSPL